MIKKLWVGFVIIMLGLGGCLLVSGDADAASKSKISCTLKNGTLTVRGKGALKLGDVGADKKEIKQVKKIVVEKGITSIPQHAFSKFRNAKEVEIASTVKKIWEKALPDTEFLEKVTLPGTFELATERREEWKYQQKYQDDECRDDTKWWTLKQLLVDYTKIDTICFNSKLSLKTLSWVESRNLIVSESDPNYKSIDGVIYSKDGKSLVRVPAYRESLSVEEGCEEFCLSAVLYAKQTDYFFSDDGIEANCGKLTRIFLPESIKKVDAEKYAAFRHGRIYLTELEIKTNWLDSESVFSLTQGFPDLKKELILNQLDAISMQDGMYINANDSCVMWYKGSASEVTIPYGIKKIGEEAFYGTKVEQVIIPDTVTQIGPGAFEKCRQLSKLELPKNITKIPNYAFHNCKSLKEMVIPDGVTTIGNDAFLGTGCKEIVLPATVKKIGEFAFGKQLKKVTICGKETEFYPETFAVCSRAVLYLQADSKEWQTWLNVTIMGGATTCDSVGFEWGKIAGVDGWQIQVSKDKSFKKKTQTYYAGKEKRKKYIENKKIDMRYVRIRPYKIKGGNRVYGRWSIAKV